MCELNTYSATKTACMRRSGKEWSNDGIRDRLTADAIYKSLAETRVYWRCVIIG